MNWKYKWIQVVRACRNQESWLPSQFSVVCSAHFEDGHIYTTQGGNRRLTKNAVPKLKLYEKIPKKKKCEHSTPVENVSVSVQTAYIGPSAFGIDENEIITDDHVEPTSHGIERVIIKAEPLDVDGTAEVDTQTGIQVENVTIKVERKEATVASSSIEISMDPLAPQQDAENDIGFVLARSSHYKQEMKKKKEQLNICRKKIKILYQKVTRLQKRNLKLKNILKEIRYRKLIKKDVFRQLTAGLIETDADDIREK